MQVNDLGPALSESTAEVLETMFFSFIDDDQETAEAGLSPMISARLTFQGAQSGRFGVRVAPVAARSMAANFLGLDEDTVGDNQIGEVICEMANMLCGSVLSRFESEIRFELCHPELESPEVEQTCRDNSMVSRTFSIDNESMTVWMGLDQDAPGSSAPSPTRM